jgi:nucleotide-binding universal stress UspA family protein
MDALKTVLVAIDFDRASEAALSQAVRMAAWNRAAVHAVHIVDTGVVVETQAVLTGLQEQIQQAFETDAMHRWNGIVASQPGRSECKFHIAVNSPRLAVLKLIEELGADLLVMGVRTDDQDSKGPGPLAMASAEYAPCPVLLASEDHPGAYKRVLACVDFSATSRRALEAAARVALQDSAALHVLHVYRSPWRDGRVSAIQGVDASRREAIVEGLKEKVLQLCAEMGEEFAYLKPTVEVMEHQSHGRGIVDCARRIDADLVALGTRGRTNLRDVLLGSTAERVIRSAGRSVLAVRPE